MWCFFYKNKHFFIFDEKKNTVYVFKIDKFCVMNNWRNISRMTLQIQIKVYVQKHKPIFF